MKAKISTWSKGLVLPWKCYIVLLEWRVNFFLINFPGSATRERLTFPLPLLKIYLSCWVLTALSCQPSVVAKSVSARKRKKGREKKKKRSENWCDLFCFLWAYFTIADPEGCFVIPVRSKKEITQEYIIWKIKLRNEGTEKHRKTNTSLWLFNLFKYAKYQVTTKEINIA